MFEVLFTIFAIALIAGLLRRERLLWRRRHLAAQKAALELGLAYEELASGKRQPATTPRLTGHLRGHPIVIDSYIPTRGATGTTALTRIQVGGTRGGLPRSVSFYSAAGYSGLSRRERMDTDEGRAAMRRYPDREMRVPDGPSDGIPRALPLEGSDHGAYLYLAGRLPTAVAVLTADARSCASRVIGYGGILRLLDGALVSEYHGALSEASTIDVITRAMVSLAGALEDKRPIAERLAEGAANDGSGPATLRLLLLLKCFPDSAEARGVAESSLENPSNDVRLLAGRIVGGNREVSILEQLCLDDSLGEVQRDAIIQLQDRPDAAEVAPAILQAMIERCSGSGVLSALAAIGDLSLPPPSSFALIRAVGHLPASRKASAIPLLQRIGLPQAELEQVVLDLLARHQAIRGALLQTLVRVGSVDVIEPLNELKDRWPAVERRAARRTIEQIRARLGDVGGRLALVGIAPETGALSLGPDTSGALSLDSEDGRHGETAASSEDS